MSTDDFRPLALVTGASSGIGYELAAQFAGNGFDVVVASEDAGIADAATSSVVARTPAPYQAVYGASGSGR